MQWSCQFQPVLVKDQKSRPSEKSGKLAENGSGSGNNPDPVGAIESSSSAVSSQAGG